MINDVRSGYEKYLIRAVEALEDFHIQPGCGAILMGSLAEGMGNDRSDIDILVVDPNGGEYPTFVQITWAGNQRAEVLFRTLRDLELFSERMRGLAQSISAGARPPANHDLYVDCEEYHKYGNGIVLKDAPVLEKLNSLFTVPILKGIKTYYEKSLAEMWTARAGALHLVGLVEEAQVASRQALIHHLSAWASSRGQTYPSNKFLDLKLARAGMDCGEVEHVLDRLSGRRVDHRSADTFSLPDHFVGEIAVSSGNLQVIVDQDVQAYELFSCLLIPFQSGMLYVSPSFRPALKALLARARRFSLADCAPEEIALIRELFRLGLAQLDLPELEGMEPISCRGVPPAHASGFAISWDGLAVESKLTEPLLTFVPLDPASLADSGVQILHHGFGYAALREDVIGAVRARQWPLVSDALARMVASLGLGLLASRGVTPLPSHEFVPAALQNAGLDPAVERLCREVPSWRVTDLSSARRIAELIASQVEEHARQIFGQVALANENYAAGEAMRRSTVQWWLFAHQQGLSLGFHPDWSAELQELYTSPDPVETARDQMFRLNNNSEAYVNWKRDDSIAHALADAGDIRFEV